MTIEIEKAYLLTTTRCNDSCRYCIVRKGDVSMSAATVTDALTLVFNSDGDHKKIAFYGGEPLLRFDLVETALQQLDRLTDQTGKRGAAFLYTNGAALDAPTLRILARHNVGLIASLDVCQQLWPENRRSPRHLQSYPIKSAHLQIALDVLGAHRVCGASVLLPDEADCLMEQARFMYEVLGLETIKILPGLARYHWHPDQLQILGQKLSELEAYLFRSLSTEKPRFFDLLNEAVLRASESTQHPGIQIPVVEFYPNRSFGMSPCEFEMPADIDNVNDTDAYLLGELDNTCLEEIGQAYRRINRTPRHTGLRLLSLWCERTARNLLQHEADSLPVRRYLQMAKEKSFA